jgi:hypothetical protein
MKPQPSSPLLLLGLLLAVCLVRPTSGDPMALAAMQPTAFGGASGERSGFTYSASRRSACAFGQRYSSFYGKCVRWYVVRST